MSCADPVDSQERVALVLVTPLAGACGDDAEAAARKKGEDVTNDDFTVIDDPKLRTLIADGKTKVTVLAGDSGCGPESEPSNVADFAVDRHKEAGSWVTIVDGIVTEIEEQYQP